MLRTVKSECALVFSSCSLQGNRRCSLRAALRDRAVAQSSVLLPSSQGCERVATKGPSVSWWLQSLKTGKLTYFKFFTFIFFILFRLHVSR